MKKIVSPRLYLFLFLITFIVNGCTKLASDFDSNYAVSGPNNLNSDKFTDHNFCSTTQNYRAVI